MNVFAWNILIPWDVKVELKDFDYVESLSKSGKKVLYIFWETEISKSQDLRDFFDSHFSEISYYDMSLSSNQAVWVSPYEYEAWVYECARFEWENVDFEEIADRFEDVEWVFAIREAEDSELFWNKVVKVDFIY